MLAQEFSAFLNQFIQRNSEHLSPITLQNRQDEDRSSPVDLLRVFDGFLERLIKIAVHGTLKNKRPFMVHYHDFGILAFIEELSKFRFIVLDALLVVDRKLET